MLETKCFIGEKILEHFFRPLFVGILGDEVQWRYKKGIFGIRHKNLRTEEDKPHQSLRVQVLCKQSGIAERISVPAKWIRTARHYLLNIYTDNKSYQNPFAFTDGYETESAG